MPSVVPSYASRAAGLFEDFHGHAADDVEVRRVSRVIPPVVVRLGALRGLIYRTDKGRRGRDRNFIHFLHDPPLLVANPEGDQLYVVGGSYRVTSRGIEG